MDAEVAQLIEHLPSKQNVAGLSPVFRSSLNSPFGDFFCTQEEVDENQPVSGLARTSRERKAKREPLPVVSFNASEQDSPVFRSSLNSVTAMFLWELNYFIIRGFFYYSHIILTFCYRNTPIPPTLMDR